MEQTLLSIGSSARGPLEHENSTGVMPKSSATEVDDHTTRESETESSTGVVSPAETEQALYTGAARCAEHATRRCGLLHYSVRRPWPLTAEPPEGLTSYFSTGLPDVSRARVGGSPTVLTTTPQHPKPSIHFAKTQAA